MCGIAGVISRTAGAEEEAMRYAARLKHRGPDDHGLWSDPELGVALAHLRLAIVDLTAEGHQPMISRSGRFVLVFNGEIYNFLELRRELEDEVPFRGRSDTEVMLAMFERFGVREAIARMNGMFAFALWDRRERVLSLVRDRLGKKPLAYAWLAGRFVFFSELKALQGSTGLPLAVRRESLEQLVRYGYIPAPWTIYEDVFKVPPASIIELPYDDLLERPSGFTPDTTPVRYWSLRDVAESPTEYTSEEAALEHTHSLLLDAVRIRMIADVPLGAFLSSGVDSSLVVAMMQAQSSRPVRTFSIGFENGGYNEAPAAKTIAGLLRTEHTEFYLTEKDLLNEVGRLPEIYDEPFADPSLLPTYLVSRLARAHVTVSLTGDGGDEVFLGYNRYTLTERAFRMSRILCLVPGLSHLLSNQAVRTLLAKAAGQASGPAALNRPEEKLAKLMLAMSSSDEDEFYERLVSFAPPDEQIVLGVPAQKRTLVQSAGFSDMPNFVERIQYADLARYLPDDNLAKVDRASMAVALETRAPLLDYRVVEAAASIPLTIKLRNGERKSVLRALLLNYLPKEIGDRPKMGFSVPVAAWLRGPLTSWASDLLDEGRLRSEKYLNADIVLSHWREHREGRHDWSLLLWPILMFQSWRESLR